MGEQRLVLVTDQWEARADLALADVGTRRNKRQDARDVTNPGGAWPWRWVKQEASGQAGQCSSVPGGQRGRGTLSDLPHINVTVDHCRQGLADPTQGTKDKGWVTFWLLRLFTKPPLNGNSVSPKTPFLIPTFLPPSSFPISPTSKRSDSFIRFAHP